MKGSELGSWLFTNAILALAVLVVAKTGIVDGIRCDDGLTLVVVVVLISLLNSLLRPLLLLVATPLIIATFGLFLIVFPWAANAVVLYLVGHTLGLGGFHVDTIGAAIWGSLWISIVGYLINAVLGRGNSRRPPGAPGATSGKKTKPDDSDVIDV